MGGASPGERERLERLRAGTLTPTEVIEAAYPELAPRLWRLCLGFLGKRADAEDALQETFVAMVRGLPTFRGEASLATWGHRIAVRTCLKIRARTARAQAEPSTEGEMDPRAGLHDRDGLRRAFELLSADHRAVVLLAAQGFTGPELSEILGVPEGTVWSRLSHARRKLAEALDAMR